MPVTLPTCECVEALIPFDRLTQIYAAIYVLAGEDASLPTVECVAGKSPWSRLEDIYCAVRLWAADDTLPSCLCVAGQTVSDQLAAIYEALLVIADDATLPSVVCFNGLTLSEQFTVIYEALYDAAQFDPDAAAFFVRAGITDSTQKDAVNALVLQLKEDGIWEKFTVIYPFVGGTADSHAENLIADTFQITWNGGVVHDANGVTGNGTTGYGDLNGSEADVFGSATDLHASAYLRDESAADAAVRMSISGGNAYMFRYNDGGTNIMAMYMAGSMINFSIGFAAVGQIVTGQLRMQANAATATFAGADPTLIGAAVNILRAPNGTQYSNVQHAFFSAGNGLDQTELLALYNAVQTYQTALGRAV